MKARDIPIFLSMLIALVAIPLTLMAVKVNQDNRSQAMMRSSPLPVVPTLVSPSATPTPSLLSPKP